jgi:hypothetical protein
MTGGFGNVVFPGGTAATGAQRNFGNVVFPGGTAATGIQRNFGNVVFPGGGGPRLVVPGSVTDTSFATGLSNTIQGRRGFGDQGRRRGGPVYAFPVYTYDPGYYYNYAYPPQQIQPDQPQNVVVVYPPQPAPVVINPFESSSSQSAEEQPAFRMYQAPYNQPAEQIDQASAAAEPVHYLLAFKDHTIYSAVAYWVEGDTLHYFTAGNKHNQASLSLLDRDLTSRLNKETGAQVVLPK